MTYTPPPTSLKTKPKPQALEMSRYSERIPWRDTLPLCGHGRFVVCDDSGLTLHVSWLYFS